ncbi:hypothetical protein RAM80_07745 [Pseudomonas sp. App30]|uniref:hypothetical protein n=1 Tax=Pseudomonas sp. App30 TaxID=3068990 RepID=UPI003A810157
MSKDQISVPRELLERLERIYMDGMSIYGECEEIRALLAQPNTCTKDGGQCGLGGYCEPCRNVESAADHHWNCPNCPPPGATHTISGQFYRKADGSWLVFGHKRDWVPSDAPAGWNDTNLVPLLPEPALARCTCPSGDGSLRWPCPVCPPEPVAYLCEATHESGRPAKWLQYGRKISNLWRADEVSLVPLYRHSAAQAPVVLPERRGVPRTIPSYRAEGWNACLDEFKRLNPGITGAAPLRKS